MTRIVMVVAIVVSVSCGKSDDKAAPAAGSAAPSAAPGAPPIPAAMPPAASASAKLTCDEDRYAKWLAMKKEMNAATATGLQDTGKKVSAAGKDTVEGKGEAITGLAATGHELQAIEAKYGFDHKEEQQWSTLAGIAMNVRPLDNPMMKDMVDRYRKMQAGGGTDKDTADKFFSEQEAQGKKAEAKARERWGDACVDLMIKHSAEVLDVTMASAKAVFGGKK